MSKVATVSRAQLGRALQAMRDAGTPAKAVVCLPDGSIAALTEAPDVGLPSNDVGDWVDLAGENEHAEGH